MHLFQLGNLFAFHISLSVVGYGLHSCCITAKFREFKCYSVEFLVLKYNKTLFFLSLLHKRCERLVKIVFCRRGVDDHQSFSISTQRVLHHLREMKHILVELLVYVGVQN